MIKVLQISKYYYPFLGGTEQVARDIATCFNLYANKIQQKIICFNEDVASNSFCCKHNETLIDNVDGVEVIRCGYDVKISSQAISHIYERKLKEILDDFNPNIIIFHYPNPFVAHILLKYSNYRFKLLIYWHLDITKQKFLKHLFYNQNIKLIERADKILGATPIHLNESEFSKFFANKKVILPYSIDVNNLKISEDEVTQANEIKRKYKNDKIVFFIGRHIEYKGIEYLIQVANKLKNEKIHYIIAGTGPLTDKLKRLSLKNENIEFVGKISDSQKRIYLYACDVFAFPSITRNEAFGIALGEAMYFEKPAVTFKIKGSGVNYLSLNGVTCIECENRNVDEYANAIRTLCNDSVLRKKLGKAAKNRIIENFTIEKFNENLVKCININN